MRNTGLSALREGRAVVDLSPWRKAWVGGGDARGWLNDLITADIDDLGPGVARRSLLLTPTGRIRADFTVTPLEEGFLLLQDPEQPHPVDGILQRYVLSSDVHLVDRTGAFALLAYPGVEPPGVPRSARWRPSCLGEGWDLLLDLGDTDALARAPSGLEPASLEDLEAWRVERGSPRFGVDLLEDSLPHKAGLDDAIAYGKGCFLGQEAVAKVRNLGHPPYVVLGGVADREVGAGDVLRADEKDVGLVTSATPLGDGTMAVLVRVRWGARDGVWTGPSGAVVRRRIGAAPDASPT